MKQFRSIEKLDTAILYALELAASASVLLLAFGLIASMANVLTEGPVLTGNPIMQRIWAWTQCVAIDASVAGTIIRTFRYRAAGERVKAWLYGLLSALLLFTAAIVSNIESVQQTLNLTLDAAYMHVFVPVEALIWIRSIAIVLLIVAHALRHVQLARTTPREGALSEGAGFSPGNSPKGCSRFVRSQLLEIGARQPARDQFEWPCPALRLVLQPIQDFKRLLSRLFDDGVAPGGAVEDLVVFGIHAEVFPHHNIYIEVGVDHLFRCVSIAGVRQDHIAIAAEKASRPVIVTDMNGEPAVAPEIAHLVLFRNPTAWSPAHFRTGRGPDDKVLVAGRDVVAMPAGPLAAVYQHFPNIGL